MGAKCVKPDGFGKDDEPFAFPNGSNPSPLHVLASSAQNNSEAIRKIVKDSPQLLEKRFMKFTPLALSVYSACYNSKNFKTLLSLSANPNCGGDPNDGSAIHIAVQHDDVGKVKLLLAHGADPNCRANKNANPVMKMCKSSAVGRLLISCGANLNQRNYCGWSVLHFLPVDGRNQSEMIKFCLANGFRTEWDHVSHQAKEMMDHRALRPLSETAMIGSEAIELFKALENGSLDLISIRAEYEVTKCEMEKVRAEIHAVKTPDEVIKANKLSMRTLRQSNKLNKHIFANIETFLKEHENVNKFNVTTDYHIHGTDDKCHIYHITYDTDDEDNDNDDDDADTDNDNNDTDNDDEDNACYKEGEGKEENEDNEEQSFKRPRVA